MSIQGAGRGLLLTDIGLLLAYGIVGICVWYQRRADVGIALRVGMLAGLVLGTVHVVNQVIEASVPNRHFAFIISPVLLMLALFGAAGSAAWERTRSFTPAVMAGVWCAMVAMLILLCFAFAFNLAFEGAWSCSYIGHLPRAACCGQRHATDACDGCRGTVVCELP